ncbi:MAG: biopolymer transporter ExbD [Alphaproteobacteria bacterium]|nr:biopolymer transporter ExbD [Alphaproteobacteria bacterium]HPF46551.1 biopolymer transporter ExbD [Emcibacteraceae bacterium]HRW30498.1 biopolymer transporter ExbD [Emcibacteraceae bacterium]
MAMNGFENDDYAAPMAEINTTPLVDVMLVLLVIFMVTAPMLTQAIKVELPSDAATQIADENPIVITISLHGIYYWNDMAMTETKLEQRLQLLSDSDKNSAIHLRADVNVLYGSVSRFLSLAQKYGLKNIGFITDPE